MDLNRESIVSAITKKVRSGRMFKRVAPNTFTIPSNTQSERLIRDLLKQHRRIVCPE